jgi:hypothetical protein
LKNAPGKEERRTAVVSPKRVAMRRSVSTPIHTARRGLRAPDAKADEVNRNLP